MIQEDLQILLLLLTLAGIYAVWPLIRTIWEERRFIQALKVACRKRRLSCAFFSRDTPLPDAFDAQKRALFATVTKALDVVVLGEWKSRSGAFRIVYRSFLHPHAPKKKLVVRYGVEFCASGQAPAATIEWDQRIVVRTAPVFSAADVARFERWLDEVE